MLSIILGDQQIPPCEEPVMRKMCICHAIMLSWWEQKCYIPIMYQSKHFIMILAYALEPNRHQDFSDHYDNLTVTVVSP